MTAYRMVDTAARIAALNPDDIEICGAYPDSNSSWTLFVTQLISQSIGLQIPPHHEHFWGDSGRSCARSWVEMIAALYSRERVIPKASAGGDCSGAVAHIEEQP